MWKFSTAILLPAVLLVLIGTSVQAQKGSKLDSRVAQLLEWNTRRSIITLSSEKFNSYVRSKPRNYSIIAMMTALRPQRGCSVCQEAHKEYEILANSWRYSQQYSSKLFFVMVDVDEDGLEIFQHLQLTTAPTYFHFPMSGKRKAEDKYDITRHGYTAEPLSNWVSDRTGVKINIQRPPNLTVMLVWVPLVLLAAVLGYLKRENLHVLYEPKYWAALAMIWIFVMLSGQMWNHIRGPPLYHRNPQTGQVGYFSGTSQYQFVAETYFVLLLYILISVGVVLMGDKFTILEDIGIQKYAPLAGLAIVVLTFGYLLSIFRMKYQGYPYSFLFK